MNHCKTIPAGAGEKIQYAAHGFNDNTIRFVLGYPGKLDPNLLRAAAKAVTDSVDILHASFYAGDIGAHWQVNRAYDDGCFFQQSKTEHDPYEEACSLALLPIKPADKTQLCCRLVQGKTGSAFALTISHLCVDGSDGKYLLGKLTEAYSLLATKGNTEGLAIKNGSRDTTQPYQDIHGQEFLSLMKAPGSEVKSFFPYPTKEPGTARMAHAVIPEEIIAEAHTLAKAAGATVNDLLLAAYYHGYACIPEINPSSPMSIMSMIDLRRHCRGGESEGLCNMSGTLPTILPQGIGTSFPDTLSQIARQTRAAKENPLAGLMGLPILHGVSKALPMGLLLASAGRIYGIMSLGLTNLGRLSGSNLKMGGMSPEKGLCGGPLKKKPGMQVSALSFDGTLTLCVWGEYTQPDKELIQSMLNRMALEITAYAKDKPA